MAKASNKFSEEEINRLVRFFEILMEIDQRASQVKKQVRKTGFVRGHIVKKGF